MEKARPRRIALAIALLSIVGLLLMLVDHRVAQTVFPGSYPIGLAAAAAVIGFACFVVLTSFDRGRSTALIRLDWFVPALRKTQSERPDGHSLVGRWLRRWLPSSLQSNHLTKRRGLVRRVLRRLGPSWLASPVRRIVQAICLCTFIALFFVVCWPYSARPESAASWSSGWVLKEVDQRSGEFVFVNPVPAEWVPSSGDRVTLIEGDAADKMAERIGRFTTTEANPTMIRALAEAELTTELLSAFLTATGSFSICEKDPLAWPTHYAANLSRKEMLPAETFLIIDPLVGLSTAIASRNWTWSLSAAVAILIACVIIPRGFCGYLCPLGTTIDLFDWAITSRVKRWRVSADGWWVHIKYYLLAGTLIAAVCGVLVSGYVSAIPVLTRGMLFLFDPLHTGLARGWHLVPPMNAGQLLSIVLFLGVLSLGFFRPRFWCKYVCPSGAVFSLGNLFRATQRKVEASCIHCNKCVEICPFDAIKADFTTRTTDCTMCQTCGGVCPTHAIKFVERGNFVQLKVENDPPTSETRIGRRGFLSLASGSVAATVGGVAIATATKSFGARLNDTGTTLPVRPPGSVPEREFLEMCIRCGECFKACPNNVLQAEGFQQGLEGLWTPLVNADWAGCESSCNACGQVCPTGAIRALPIEEKRHARMGLAIVNEETCLPFADRDDCDLCVRECQAAGYDAIEYLQVGTQMDEFGVPIEGTGRLAPVVIDQKCVGCGLCQTRCFAINVKEKHVLRRSAIIIQAGEENEDRMMSGSYRELHLLRTTDSASDIRRDTIRAPKEIETAPNSAAVTEAEDPFGVGAPTDDGLLDKTSKDLDP